MHQKLIDDAINIHRRTLIQERLGDRSDIYEYAQTIVDIQDGKTLRQNVHLDIGSLAIGRFIARTIECSTNPEQEKMPVGCKMSRLQFSPLYQLYITSAAIPGMHARADSMSGIPKTADEIAEWLHVSMGDGFLFEATFTEEDESTTAALLDMDVFSDAMCVRVKDIAGWIFQIRKTDAILYLLILSGEIELAVKHCKFLAYCGGTENKRLGWRERYFPGMKHSIATVLKCIRTTQQAVSIIKALSADSWYTISSLHQAGCNLGASTMTEIDRKHLSRAVLSVFGLRKILCLDIDKQLFEKQSSDVRTVAGLRSHIWLESKYGKHVLDNIEDQITKNLPSMTERPEVDADHSEIIVTRMPGSGGIRKDRLASFYGLDGIEIASLIAIIVGEATGQSRSKIRLARFASALVKGAGYSPTNVVQPVRSDHIIKMVKVRKHAFPRTGRFGHSACFDLDSWSANEADQNKWKKLVLANSSTDQTTEMILIVRDYFFLLIKNGLPIHKLEEACRIFCYLAPTYSMLSADPIWIRIQERVRVVQRAVLKKTLDKAKTPRKFNARISSFEQIMGLLRFSHSKGVTIN